MPLPFVLGSIGAPGCTLYTSIDVSIPASIQPLSPTRGLARVTLRLPGAAMFAATMFHSQWILLDPAVNPLGLTFSNGVSARLGGTPPGRDAIWVESTDISTATGNLLPGRVPVLSIER